MINFFFQVRNISVVFISYINTLVAVKDGKTSITWPICGGELSIINDPESVYDESLALLVA